METKKHFNTKKAILVDEDHLNYFYNFLKERFEVINISAKTNDDSSFEFSSYEELLRYENPNFKKITKLRFDCYKHENGTEPKYYSDRKKTLSLDIGDDSTFLTSNTLSYYLSYDDLNWGIPLELDLKKRITDLQTAPIISFITNSPFIIYIPLLYLLFIILLYTLNLTFTLPKEIVSFVNNLFIIRMQINPLGSMLSSVIMIAAGYLLDKYKGLLFPKSFISLGRQKKELNKIEKRRNILFIVIGLGIVINIISSIIIN